MTRPARLTRRSLLKCAAALSAVSLVRCRSLPMAGGTLPGRLAETPLGAEAVTLVAAPTPMTLPGGAVPLPLWLYNDAPFPVLKARANQPMSVRLINRLPEHSSIHWHGIRLPNAMDGVPFLTQMPVLTGEEFLYDFTPPDPGTFFFHSHCNTVEQFGRGLAGILIVEGDGEAALFDDDVLCVLKDWRVDANGAFLPFMTTEGAGRAGSFGALRTTNFAISPVIDVPAGANVRLRIANLDATRTGEIGVEGAEAFIIAVDGNAIAPVALQSWRLGPAMRLDLVVRTPSSGSGVRLLDYFAAEPVVLATLRSAGEPLRQGAFTPPALPLPHLAEPDVAGAPLRAMALTASAVATQYPDLPPIVLPNGETINLLDSLCATPQTLWSVDGKTWPQQGHQNLPPPILSFVRGETAHIEFFNGSRFPHPMHLHGHTFKVLSASVLERPMHWADTVLVMPDERVRIAFVADNPGRWMLHCHIIEHQDTGMMAWFDVA